MFTVHNSTFEPTLVCSVPVSDDKFTLDCAQFYDKDGFELTPLEQALYEAAGVALTSYLYNLAAHKAWLELVDNRAGLFLDHSMILERYRFDGPVREQLKNKAVANPQLLKLLTTKSKWGIDFSLDYIADDEVTDVFHIEIDSYDLDQILAAKANAEQVILNIDWVDGAKRIRKLKDSWAHLEGHAQSNWKARYFGFTAAEDIRKAF